MTPPSTARSRRIEILETWDRELRLHFAIEEEDLFPALRAAADARTRDLLDRLLEEHRRLAELREAVDAAGPETLDAALGAFADLLEEHVRTEERELFAAFPDGLAAAEVERLHRTIHRRRPPDTPVR